MCVYTIMKLNQLLHYSYIAPDIYKIFLFPRPHPVIITLLILNVIIEYEQWYIQTSMDSMIVEALWIIKVSD